MGFASAIVVLFAMLIAVTLLPPAWASPAGIDRWSIPIGRTAPARATARWPVGPTTLPSVALRNGQPGRPGDDLTAGVSLRCASPTTQHCRRCHQHLAYDLLVDGFGLFTRPYAVVASTWPHRRPAPIAGLTAAIAADAGLPVQPALLSADGRTRS